MDFALSDEQESFAELARQILADGCTKERLLEVEKSDGPRFDPRLWSELATAGLLGIALPEAQGGAGLGFFELAMVVEQVGAHAAPVPLLETLVLGAAPIAEFGSEAQKQAHLPDVTRGDRIITAALVEALSEIERPQTKATPKDGGYALDGVKTCVPAAQLADLILVPATIADDVALFLVDPKAAGVLVEPVRTTSGQPEARVSLNGVQVAADDVLGTPGQGAEILEWMRLRATAAQCALALGVCSAALSLTAEYTKERKQFGSPIATFQAVGQRMADAYVDVEAIRLTSWQAAWRLAEGLDAREAVAKAKYWASFGGQRVVHTAVHQHGGMGVDRDYPLHRFFLYEKQLELALGGSSAQLRRLGRMIADGEA
jgi:alkylation response protein AidB-like acyl-CoA dehydrogenase